MLESYLSLGENTLFCRHGPIREGRPGLLLLRGLGDSGLAFGGIFADARFEAFNVVVPDLLGYGRSSRSPERRYGFEEHLALLWQVIDYFGLEQVTLVGHSMGGELGSLLCLQEATSQERNEPLPREPRIARFCNVEGNLTPADLSISGEAVKAQEGGRFADWFTWDFTYRKVYGEWCRSWRFGRSYLASLQFCDPEAFLQNAGELYRARDEAGAFYRDLALPKLFVFGQQSLARESRHFAAEAGLYVHEVAGSHHWPMLDSPEDFYGALARFCWGEPVGLRMTEPAAPPRTARKRPVAQVRLEPPLELGERGLLAILDGASLPWRIVQARQAQDALLARRYSGQPLRIAEIGCGSGGHAATYAAHCTLYHAYESSGARAEAARRSCADLPNVVIVEIVEGDAREAELRSDRYDVAWCLDFAAASLHEPREILSSYDDAYLKENPRLLGILTRFYAALEVGGSLFLTLYKDTPEAEEAQRSLGWRTGQFVLTDFGSPFVATDQGFWSARSTPKGVLRHLGEAGLEEANVTFHDLNEIAWLVEARK